MSLPKENIYRSGGSGDLNIWKRMRERTAWIDRIRYANAKRKLTYGDEHIYHPVDYADEAYEYFASERNPNGRSRLDIWRDNLNSNSNPNAQSFRSQSVPIRDIRETSQAVDRVEGMLDRINPRRQSRSRPSRRFI